MNLKELSDLVKSRYKRRAVQDLDSRDENDPKFQRRRIKISRMQNRSYGSRQNDAEFRHRKKF